LLEVCRSLTQSLEFEPVAALGTQGPIKTFFEALCPTHVFPYPLAIPFTHRLQKSQLTRIRKYWLRRVIERSNPDVILHNTGTDVSVMEELQSTGIPVIAYLHGIHWDAFYSGNRHSQLLSTYATQYIACARSQQNRAVVGLGIPKSKITTIHNGLLPLGAEPSDVSMSIRSELGLGHDDFLVLGAGRISYAKGVDHFVRMAEILSNAELPFKIRCAWLGTKRDTHFTRSVDSYAKEAGLELLFLGFKHNIRDYFLAMDAFVMCSRFENLPLVVLEAMQCGKPVIAFPVGGVPEILGLGGGIMTTQLSSESLAENALLLASSRSHGHALGEIGKTVVREQFRHDTQMRLIEDVILKTTND
jgi:glycosyltransferase involved in cell wall biosynthesis